MLMFAGVGEECRGLAGCPLRWLGTLGVGARVDKGTPGDLDLNLLLTPSPRRQRHCAQVTSPVWASGFHLALCLRELD